MSRLKVCFIFSVGIFNYCQHSYVCQLTMNEKRGKERHFFKLLKRDDSFFKLVEKNYREEVGCLTENQGRPNLVEQNNTEQSNLIL